MSNVILRPVYDRPEMLSLSLEYEIVARQRHMLPGNFITLFLIEHGSPQKTVDLVTSYPFESIYDFRDRKYGLTINILEGMRRAFDLADDYVVYIEDDILLHQTYFKYMEALMNLTKEKNIEWSVLSSYSPDDNGDVGEVYKGHHYAALAPLISKVFHTGYIKPCSSAEYYRNPPEFVTVLNERYKKHWGKDGYKYKDTTHWEQAGMINRLVDAAMIDEQMYVMMPRVNRNQHIGYFGKNRPGGRILGADFNERLANLKETIEDADKMYELSATKQYNDYKIFSKKLDKWDGTLYVK